jgi:hypothetical protein
MSGSATICPPSRRTSTRWPSSTAWACTRPTSGTNRRPRAKKGTEASAATAIIVGVGSSLPPIEEVKTVVVDRPFLFAIRDNPTGALLFAGQAVSP